MCLLMMGPATPALPEGTCWAYNAEERGAGAGGGMSCHAILLASLGHLCCRFCDQSPALVTAETGASSECLSAMWKWTSRVHLSKR